MKDFDKKRNKKNIIRKGFDKREEENVAVQEE